MLAGSTLDVLLLILEVRYEMKVYDLYKQTKTKYPKFVIIIKVGIFYEVYGEDAYIMANLFNYKVKKLDNCVRAGFPISAYNKVISTFHNCKINYLVIDKEIIKKKFNRNNYGVYLTKNLNIDGRIENIYSRLNLRKHSPKIIDILEEVEKIV